MEAVELVVQLLVARVARVALALVREETEQLAHQVVPLQLMVLKVLVDHRE